MKLKALFLFFLVLFLAGSSFAQRTQTVKGRILDADSREPLSGVTMILMINNADKLGSISDDDGYFQIADVPIGRHSLTAQFIGYEKVVLNNILVGSGKEVTLNIEMLEATSNLKETVVVARDKRSTFNDLATASSRSFDAEEAERYPGSRQDPARMAANFAGVAGTDDNRNDIVVRGNSPLGVLWRFEGVDIFNPSHFAVAGTTGGPISMLNNKTIGNSDFLTSAFPSEYGNGISGVFDLRMRNGNYDKNEYSAQFGLFGTEFMAEGPINKEKKSSYMVSYRYATFSIFQALGIDIGTEAIPKYQDINFKLNFPNKKGGFSIFGVGGLSKIDIVFSDDTAVATEIFGQKDRDQYFRTNMGVVGANFRRYLKNKTNLNITLAQSVQQVNSSHDKIYRDPFDWHDTTMLSILRSQMMHGKTTLHANLTKKYSARHTLKVGVIADLYFVNYLDSVVDENTINWTTGYREWSYQLDAKGRFNMFRAYVADKFRLGTNVTLSTGLHLMYFDKNSEFVVEPRLGIKWKPTPSQAVAFAYGLHSQAQPLYTYYIQTVDSFSKTFGAHNADIGLTKSHHAVLSYQKTINPYLRFKVEAYYQALFNVPVERLTSSFSLSNQGSGFERFFPDALQNTGTGVNQGLELTLEKFFNHNYYVLSTLSLYDSKYVGSDGITRDTDFNGNYVFNMLAGYEKPYGPNKKNAFIFGTKLTMGGGKRYSPIDTLRTKENGAKVVFDDSQRNIFQFNDYFRFDIKLGVKINGKKATHEIAIDLVNLLDTKNVLTISYFDDPENPGSKIFAEEYQMGRLPIFYYKVDF
jgi:hypothetical protein